MKILYFDDYKLGVLKGDTVVDVSSVVQSIPHTGPHDLINGLIERFGEYRPRLSLEGAAGGKGVPGAGRGVPPPAPRPGNIDCMAVNYMEDGTRTEPAPINAFHKSPNAVIGHGDTMVLPDVPATIFEGEAEVALVIGKRAKGVKAADAMRLRLRLHQLHRRLGARPAAARQRVLPDEVARHLRADRPLHRHRRRDPDPHKLQVKLWVNGTLKQNFNTDDMAHKIPRCIEWVTSIHTLEPGDILATGTNHRGLSAFQDGDVERLETQGLGTRATTPSGPRAPTSGRENKNNRGKEGPTPESSPEAPPRRPRASRPACPPFGRPVRGFRTPRGTGAAAAAPPLPRPCANLGKTEAGWCGGQARPTQPAAQAPRKPGSLGLFFIPSNELILPCRWGRTRPVHFPLSAVALRVVLDLVIDDGKLRRTARIARLVAAGRRPVSSAGAPRPAAASCLGNIVADRACRRSIPDRLQVPAARVRLRAGDGAGGNAQRRHPLHRGRP